MSVTREKQWTDQQDQLLAQTILTQLENGGTQLEGFQVAAQLLLRTVAACGFRWNKEVRKNYAEQLTQLKERKGERKGIVRSEKRTRSIETLPRISSSPNDVIIEASRFIEQLVKENSELKVLVAKRDKEIAILTGVLQKARETVGLDALSASKKRSLKAEA